MSKRPSNKSHKYKRKLRADAKANTKPPRNGGNRGRYLPPRDARKL